MAKKKETKKKEAVKKTVDKVGVRDPIQSTYAEGDIPLGAAVYTADEVDALFAANDHTHSSIQSPDGNTKIKAVNTGKGFIETYGEEVEHFYDITVSIPQVSGATCKLRLESTADTAMTVTILSIDGWDGAEPASSDGSEYPAIMVNGSEWGYVSCWPISGKDGFPPDAVFEMCEQEVVVSVTQNGGSEQYCTWRDLKPSREITSKEISTTDHTHSVIQSANGKTIMSANNDGHVTITSGSDIPATSSLDSLKTNLGLSDSSTLGDAATALGLSDSSTIEIARQEGGIKTENVVTEDVMDAHTGNTDVHVTTTDKAAWNGLISAAQFKVWYPDGSVTSESQFTTGLKYDLDGNGNALIKTFARFGDNNSDKVGAVIIPPYIVDGNGVKHTVVGINNVTVSGVISFNTNLTSVIIPSTVTSIGKNAFHRCSNLTSVTIPDGVTSIGNEAFLGCSGLTSMTIPDSVTSLGSDVFNFCSGLTSIVIPNGVTSIGGWAFYGCRGLASITIPDGVPSIGKSTFNGCSELTSISIGNGVTSIGDYAFNGCSGLTFVDFGDTAFSSIPTLGSNAFKNVPTTCKFIVPDSQYDTWKATSGWSGLVSAGYTFLRHSEWEYVRKYELATKQDKLPASVAADVGKVLGITDSSGTLGWIAGGNYSICTPTQTVSGTSVSVQLANHAINKVSLASTVMTATISFPPQLTGYARDFFVRLEIVGSTVPAITWQESNGDPVLFDVDDDSWASIEQGVNLLMFTETAQ